MQISKTECIKRTCFLVFDIKSGNCGSEILEKDDRIMNFRFTNSKKHAIIYVSSAAVCPEANLPAQNKEFFW